MTANGRYAQVLRILDEAGPAGRTWTEVARLAGLNHGQAAGALTNLSKDGRLIKLPLTRGGRSVYLHPDHTKIADEESAGEAFDRGYSLGLSEGHQEAVINSRAEGYQQGWAEGVDMLHRELARYLDEMLRAIQRDQGISARAMVMTDKSWMVNPTHTVLAAQRFLRRTAGALPESQPVPEGVVDLTMRRESR